jgi:preprotein translocase subunit SecB
VSEAGAPVFSIEKIYMKDLSAEVPNGPQMFLEREPPSVEVGVQSEAKPLSQEGLFEVVLTVAVTAKIKDKTLFLVEVAQAGIFQIRNVPQQDLGSLLGIACPNTLFPYAREAVSAAITRAGFPPVVLAPMSFEAIYQQQQAQQQSSKLN